MQGLIYGKFNTTPDTVGSGQDTIIQTDAQGRILLAAILAANAIATKDVPPVAIPITQTVQAAAYSAGQAVGGKITLTGLGNSGAITKVVLRDKAAQVVGYNLWIFNADPAAATITDKTAFAVSTDLAKVIAIIPLSGLISGGTGGGGIELDGIYIPYNLAAGTTGYAALVTTGAPTYASTSDVSLEITAQVSAG